MRALVTFIWDKVSDKPMELALRIESEKLECFTEQILLSTYHVLESGIGRGNTYLN